MCADRALLELCLEALNDIPRTQFRTALAAGTSTPVKDTYDLAAVVARHLKGATPQRSNTLG
jgi:hypothetical protein